MNEKALLGGIPEEAVTTARRDDGTSSTTQPLAVNTGAKTLTVPGITGFSTRYFDGYPRSDQWLLR
ncbi:hypothetical protein HZA57_01970 [Candidatus Poribacteria bacterium]|nr:hypothetical protein [Candidatus Poribacteria bacterium]